MCQRDEMGRNDGSLGAPFGGLTADRLCPSGCREAVLGHCAPRWGIERHPRQINQRRVE
jgi:hypothetical protein